MFLAVFRQMCIDGNKRRGYNALRINMSALQAAQFSKFKRKSRKTGSSETDGISVAKLYDLVKRYKISSFNVFISDYCIVNTFFAFFLKK